MVRQLQPWHANVKKRQVKAPKIYIRDSGLLHGLLELQSMDDLLGHPKLGASWEGFALEQVLGIFGQDNAHFWATHAGAELDLMVTFRGRRYGFEFKVGDAPGPTRSMRIALSEGGRPVTASNAWNRRCPPSSTGIGNKFSTPRLMLTKARNLMK